MKNIINMVKFRINKRDTGGTEKQMKNIKSMLEEDILLQEKLIRRYKQAIRNLPAGYLTMRRRAKGNAYFVNTMVLTSRGKVRKQTYIKQHEGKKVWQLQMKRLMQEAIKRMQCNIERERKWLQQYQAYDFVSLQNEMREAYQNIETEQLRRGQYFYSADLLELAGSVQEVLEGISEGNFRMEGRTQRTMSGILVRSKSEVILADTLTALDIPFLYEAEVRLTDEEGKEVVLHPDFTILCPDGSVIYWEHLGLLQDRDYAQSFVKKLHVFHRNGFTIGQNLIVTADDCSGHIDSLQILELAKRVILPHMG